MVGTPCFSKGREIDLWEKSLYKELKDSVKMLKVGVGYEREFRL